MIGTLIDSTSAGGGAVTGTDGSILFIHPNDTLDQDNSNLFWDYTNQRIGVGTNTPLARGHFIGPTTTIADPSGISVSLVPASLIGAPSDSPSFFYGPLDSGGGSGTENDTYVGYNSFDTVQATVYAARISPVDGTYLTSPSGVDLGTITLGQSPAGIDWSWASSTNGDGSSPDGYVIVITDSTTSTQYSYFTASTSFADTNAGGSVSYSPFSGLTASGQSFNFEPYNTALSPSGLGTYASSSGGDFAVTEGYNNGSLFWIVHTLSGNSGTGWSGVFLLDTVQNTSVVTLENTYYQMSTLSGPGGMPYSQNYGILSDGSALNLDFKIYSEGTSPSLYFSANFVEGNTTDPNDGGYYYISISLSFIGGGDSTRIVLNGAQFLDQGSYPLSYDAFGPGFSSGSAVTPVGLSDAALIAQNTASLYSQPAALKILSSSSPMIAWANSSGTEYLRIGYESASSTNFMKLANGTFELRDSSNSTLSIIDTNLTKFNVQDSSSYQLIIPSGTYNPFFKIDASTNSLGIGPGTFNTSSYINIGAGTTSKAQLNFATQASAVLSPNNGDIWFDGGKLVLKNSSFLARILQTGTSSVLTNSIFPVADSSGNLIDSRLSVLGGTVLVSNYQIEAKSGITLDSSQNITMGSNSAITGNINLSYVAKTANYTLGFSDYAVNCTSNTFNITLPTAVSAAGRLHVIKNSGTGVITLLTTSSQTIDGFSSGTITLAQFDCYTLMSNGANWITVDRKSASFSGTVTSVSVVTANGFSGTVATSTTTPAITIVAGAITPTSVNGITLSGSSTPTLTVTGTTTVSGSNTGDQTNISGNAATVTTNANLTGDVTSSGNATTLATVNSNVGSFTNVSLTVNAKGLVTAASSGTIAPKIVASGNLLAQTATTSSVAIYTTPNDSTVHSFRIGAYTAITAISAGTLTITATFTDQNNTSQTVTYFPMGLTSAGLTTTGFTPFETANIRCKPNTAITIVATFTGVSITYDVGGIIESLY